jgi:lysozyme family protein
MANHNNLISDMLYFEGGKSSDPRDTSAARNPAPNSNGVHTNKGVTWSTFVALSPKLGYNPTTELFLLMPQSLWLKIYKEGFWDYLYLDSLNSQALANLFVQMAWGSGRDTAIRQISQWLKLQSINVPMVRSRETNQVLNTKIKTKKQELDLFLFLWEKRMQFLKSLSNWNVYKNGWTRRMEKIKTDGINLINKKKNWLLWGSIAIVTGIILTQK